MTMIPIASISSPIWNSRLTIDDKQTKELAASMKARIESGNLPLMNPIIVSDESPGHYQLVAGSRRLAAAKLLGLSEIQATIGTYTTKEAQIIDNAVENLQRVDLTTYEQARAFAEMRAAGLKVTEVRERTGKSEAHISKLVQNIGKLAEPVKIEWSKNNSAATVDFLTSIRELDEAEQVSAFKAQEKLYSRLGGDDEDEEGRASKKKATKVKQNFTVKRDLFDAVLSALKTVPAATFEKNMAINALLFVVGEVTKIPGVAVFDSDAKTAPSKAETKKKGKK